MRDYVGSHFIIVICGETQFPNQLVLGSCVFIRAVCVIVYGVLKCINAGESVLPLCDAG